MVLDFISNLGKSYEIKVIRKLGERGESEVQLLSAFLTYSQYDINITGKNHPSDL
jgi:hypothetical protein